MMEPECHVPAPGRDRQPRQVRMSMTGGQAEDTRIACAVAVAAIGALMGDFIRADGFSSRARAHGTKPPVR